MPPIREPKQAAQPAAPVTEAPLQQQSKQHSPPAFQLQATSAAPIQRQETGTDYDALAQKIYDGIHYIGGTNEDAIFEALNVVKGNSSAIARLRTVYAQNHNEGMITNLRPEWQSMDNMTKFAECIAADLTSLCVLLRVAMSGGGTDTNAVTAALLQVVGNNDRGQALQDRYLELYGVKLRTEIQEDYSGQSETNTLALMGNEYESLDKYKELTGRNELGDYEWIKADREAQSGTWDTAMANMTRDQKPNIVDPFVQVRDYYLWVAKKIKERGHETRWVLGALSLVNTLSDTYDEGVTTGHWFNDGIAGVVPLLEDLNVGICNFAITQFHRLLYGDLKDTPLTGDAAYEFDRQFVEQEQREVAFPIYSQYAGTGANQVMSNMFNGDYSTLTGAVAWASSNVPAHQDIIGADLTDASTRYGEDARTNVPLYMLWPDKHRSTNSERSTGALNPNMVQIDQELDKKSGDVYDSYSNVSQEIMSTWGGE